MQLFENCQYEYAAQHIPRMCERASERESTLERLAKKQANILSKQNGVSAIAVTVFSRLFCHLF